MLPDYGVTRSQDVVQPGSSGLVSKPKKRASKPVLSADIIDFPKKHQHFIGV